MVNNFLSKSAICRAAILCSVIVVAACAESSKIPASADVGPQPTLVAPVRSLLPTVNIAPAKGWPEGARPQAANGTQVVAFATGLVHPRWLLVLPNGDVLVAETESPPKPNDGGGGIKDWITQLMMKRSGAGSVSPNRIMLLRDADGDGVAEIRSSFLEGLHSPFGMALIGEDLYVANTDAVVRYHYTPGDTKISGDGVKVTDLPGGPINHHWTKNVVASPDGSHLYVTVGSNSNVGENGIDNELDRAAIWELDPKTGQKRLFASGLRNPNGMAWEPSSGQLWAVVNERDELGSDLVPDYLTSVHDGGFFGWPYSYYGQHVDSRVQPPRPDLVAKAIAPDYALGSHVAALGLAWYDGKTLPAPFTEGMFIGEHGSWNRRPPNGYKVVFVPFSHGKPSGMPIEVLRGFLGPEGEAWGRPVGVAVDRRGGLLVADDVGNIVWRISPKSN
jgi:glucose/arabinose dehydrogenase